MASAGERPPALGGSTAQVTVNVVNALTITPSSLTIPVGGSGTYLLTIAAATWLLTPIVRGLGHRLQGGRAGDAELRALRAELEALREELLDDQQRVRADLGELTERMDFAERLLAQQRETPRLPGA